jgi:hypothetical protein
MQAEAFNTSGLTLALLDMGVMGGLLESSMSQLSQFLTAQMNATAGKHHALLQESACMVCNPPALC